TGASGGIGLEMARIHARNGDDLVLVARSEDKLLELKRALEKAEDIEVQVIVKDLASPDAAREIHSGLTSEGVKIDYLINNAGIGDYGLFHESSWEKQAAMIDLNVKSLTRLAHLFSADMVRQGSGRIMNVASTASFQPGPLMSVYYATKHYVLAFSEAIAQELDEYGITVTALCPGPTESGFQKQAKMEESRLVTTFPLPSAREVAEYGYRAMMNGKRVAVHGMMNKFLAQSVRFAPRKLSTAVVRKLQETR
ncbi:MAG: SDR family oxidoreductase, partial [Balneolaceae bacterium]